MSNLLNVPNQSPGVYVFEEPSAVKAIAGVSTSTAGFIGVLPNNWKTKLEEKQKTIGPTTVESDTFDVDVYPAVKQENVPVTTKRYLKPEVEYTVTNKEITLKINNITGKKFDIYFRKKSNGEIGELKDAQCTANKHTLLEDPSDNSITIQVNETIADAKIINNPTAKVKFSNNIAVDTTFKVDYSIKVIQPSAKECEPYLCTNFTEFRDKFGDFDGTNSRLNQLRYAVFGFFNNGGTRCYVIWSEDANIDAALKQFETIDEIALVAAPGITETAIQKSLIDHCQKDSGIFYRFAILDGSSTATYDKPTEINNQLGISNYAALYYPWIKVADAKNPKNTVDIPPSGHIAGIYARVDAERGVHKAPANESIRGALDVTKRLSKPQQEGLNPDGINCIRVFNNNILVWGARTLGGNKNQDLKYINVRRTLLFLRKSIDHSTQWVVFEPNTPALWQKIVRNVSAFLTDVWRSGALFGNTPQEAFYVRCDAEINSASRREQGLVVTEIGVAIARPAEFVVFQISQFSAPT